MNAECLAKLVSPCEGKSINVLGNQLRVILTGEDTGGTMELVEMVSPPGCGIPPHIHTREDEVFIVREGKVEFFVDGKKHELAAGDVVYGRRDISHGYVVVGSEPCTMYFTVSPASLEPMFDELAAINDPDPVRIGEVCLRYGIEFIG